MSDSCSSTVPNTPQPFDEVANIVNKNGAFALLRPFNDDARTAFSATVNTIIEDTTNLERFHRFLCIDGKAPRGGSVYTEDEDNNETCRASDDTQWSGSFIFNLALLPNHAPSWYMGTDQIPQNNDILLALPSTSWKNVRVARRHARLYHHHESYRFMLEAYHSVTIGKNGAKILTGSRSHDLEHGELVVIGFCSYVFEYTDFAQTPAFETDLSGFATKYFGAQSLHRHLLPTSVGNPIMLGDYYCSPSAFAQGTFGKVSAGWAGNGRAVAIKTFKKPEESVIEAHKEIMNFIGRHDNIVELVDCVSHFKTSVSDAYCVYAPLAVASLHDLIRSYEVDPHAQVTLLRAYANGLSFLHNDKGVMHGDISPNNLVVTSINPPRGMIIDLDTAFRAETSTLHNNGVVEFLAPEILALKLNESTTPFDRSVDVWALGLSMLCVYRGRIIRWKDFSDNYERRVKRAVNRPCHEGFRTELEATRSSFPADLAF